MKFLHHTKDSVKKLAEYLSWKKHLPWCAGLFLIILVLFGRYLVSGTLVVSQKGNDVYSYYLHTQTFTSTELGQGNLPRWNQFTYGGHPYLADFQSALLYPVTWVLGLLLKPVTAINWWCAIHVFLFGLLTYAWAAFRGMKPAAAFVAGVAAMLGGTFYMHVLAGHLSNLGSMAWAPLVFLGIDGWLRRRHAGWLVLGAIAATLQVYAGNPQYVYYTAIAAGLYSLVNLAGSGPDWKKAALGLIAIYPLAVLLSAAQLWPGYNALSELVRSGGTSVRFASMFGFLPQNLVTLVAPWGYGGTTDTTYWGGCYLWEMQAFLGIGMTLLAIHGFGAMGKATRWRSLVFLALVFILALGKWLPPYVHVPDNLGDYKVGFLYYLMYKAVPFYSSFRGTSKFIFIIGLFVAMLAGAGMDRLLTQEKRPLKLGVAALALGVIALILGVLIHGGAMTGAWQKIFDAASSSPESYFKFEHADLVGQPAFMEQARHLTGLSLIGGGVWLVIFGALLSALKLDKRIVWAAGACAVINLGWFAWNSTTGFQAEDAFIRPLEKVLSDNKGDYRTWNAILPSVNMSWRRDGIWGSDPSVLKRYAEYMYYSQGLNPDAVSQDLSIRQKSPLLNLVRGRIGFLPVANNYVQTIGDPAPRFFMASQYTILSSRDEILRTLASPDFQPKQQVILESKPNPMPELANVAYSIRMMGASTDMWLLEIVVDHPTILVMTDAYAKGWTATPLPGSVQSNYNVMPANYAMRAIPLAQGTHRIRLEYVQPGLAAGVHTSLLVTLLLVVIIIVPASRRRLHFSD